MVIFVPHILQNIGNVVHILYMESLKTCIPLRHATALTYNFHNKQNTIKNKGAIWVTLKAEAETLKFFPP
jgi:hypothetical protein